MILPRSITLASILFSLTHAQQISLESPFTAQTFTSTTASGDPWIDKYGPQRYWGFIGLPTFAHLNTTKCLENPDVGFDIAIVGMPFDTAVTYRPGARFGPNGIRAGSRLSGPFRGATLDWGVNPFDEADIIDCGDIPITPFDNALALDMMEVGYDALLKRPTVGKGQHSKSALSGQFAKDGTDHPRIITLGGDHTVVLPILRSLHKVYGPVSVIHFDSHLDTGFYNSSALPNNGTFINHGSYFFVAHSEGLITEKNIHVGIKAGGLTEAWITHDATVGFEIIASSDIEEIGVKGIVEWIRERVGTGPVYLTFDIDVIDIGEAPATGTPEPAGWTMREAKQILKGLAGLNIIGADLVEVAPAYDNAEVTAINAASLVHDFMSLMVSDGKPKKIPRTRNGKPY